MKNKPASTKKAAAPKRPQKRQKKTLGVQHQKPNLTPLR